jgi:hypothetical protein
MNYYFFTIFIFTFVSKLTINLAKHSPSTKLEE